MSKQTAVEWFMDIMKDLCEFYPEDMESVFDAFYHAKEMEKEQIKDAFNEGIDWHRDYFGKQKGVKKILPDNYGEGNDKQSN
jgi:hypothetical protein